MVDLPWPWPTGHGAPILIYGLDLNVVYPEDRPIEGPEPAWIVLTFTNTRAIRFGPPSEASMVGHPLYDAGLRHYELHRIVNSPWPKEVGASRDDHWMLTFADGAVECLCEGPPVSRIEHRSLAEVAYSILALAL